MDAEDAPAPLEFIGLLLPGHGAEASVRLAAGEALFVSHANGALVRLDAPIGQDFRVSLRDDEPSRPLLVIQADAALGPALVAVGAGWTRSLTNGESVPSALNLGVSFRMPTAAVVVARGAHVAHVRHGVILTARPSPRAGNFQPLRAPHGAHAPTAPPGAVVALVPCPLPLPRPEVHV